MKNHETYIEREHNVFQMVRKNTVMARVDIKIFQASIPWPHNSLLGLGEGCQQQAFFFGKGDRLL